MHSSADAWTPLWEEPAALSRPLCVDLDGTLLHTDTLWEGVLLLLRRSPWLALLLPFWLLGGRAGLKRQVAARVALDPSALPYREDLLAALRVSKERGRKLVLATAADRDIAERIAQHLGLFDEVLSSDGLVNFKAAEKRKQLAQIYASGFDYVGDSPADLPVFEGATRGYLVGSSARLKERAERSGNVVVVSSRLSLLAALRKELRLHQWAKNALVILPVALAPGLPDLRVFAHVLGGALAFSLCASAGYVWNDLLDLDADRAHPTKKARPFASGALPVVFGPPLFIGLLLTSFALSGWLLPVRFSVALAVYFVGTMAYSLYLKRVMIIDVLVLAGLYTHRILAGGMAASIRISAWLLGFSMFLFLSLAFAKRYVELWVLEHQGKIKNRDYYKADLQMIGAMGPASGVAAALVFSLYVEMGTQSVYTEPLILWLAVPVLLYWVTRIWILTGRGQMQDDPVRFALKDRASLVCGLIIGALFVFARFTPEWLRAIWN